MEIIAHRGASHEAPENTLAAVSLAWRQKADAVEIDVRLSKDGKLAVIHDNNTRRTGRLNRRISEQTLAELRSLDVGRWKGRRWIGERIPMLEEVLATIPPGKRLLVEFKCGPYGISEFKQAVERSSVAPPQVVAASFSRETMKQLKAEMPGLEVCWIVLFKRNWRTRRWSPATDALIDAVKKSGLDGVDLDARGPVSAAFVKKLKADGLKVYVWTVDSPAKARKLMAAGVHGITTNRPGWLREKLAHARRTG